MSFFEKLFGEKYAMHVGPFQTFYMRFVMLRWLVIDLPFWVLVMYLTPFQSFYNHQLGQRMLEIYEVISSNSENYILGSSDPAYAVMFICVINLVGVVSLTLAFIYTRPFHRFVSFVENRSTLDHWVFLSSACLLIAILWIGLFYSSGSNDFLGCKRCAHASKLFLVVRFCITWGLLHYSVAITTIYLKCIPIAKGWISHPKASAYWG